jgi:hypothetical protein
MLAVLLVMGACALMVCARAVRVTEAALQNGILSLGLPSHRVGTAVTFPAGGRMVGISFSLGCSVGPPLALFLAGAGVIGWLRPLPLRSILFGTTALTGMFVIANQLRIGLIVASMRILGFHRGYALSHVFLGSIITTLGFVLGVLLFVRVLVRAPAAHSAQGAEL